MSGGDSSQGNFKVGNPYNVDGQYYYPEEKYSMTETGIASWYGPGFHGKRTANGERFDTGELTAAHKTLQMPSLIRVTNLDNGRSLILRVNDRGPFSRGRVLDVSERAADLLGFKNIGTAKVKVQVLEKESRQLAAMAKAGQDTRGFEVAMNQNRVPPMQPPPAAPEPISSVQLASAQQPPQALIGGIEGHTSTDGRFMPDPVVTQLPVTKTSIYVQAGSFSMENNALALSQKLSTIGPAKVFPAEVNGKPYYRVRVGPYRRVEEADFALAQVISGGSDSALIVVD